MGCCSWRFGQTMVAIKVQMQLKVRQELIGEVKGAEKLTVSTKSHFLQAILSGVVRKLQSSSLRLQNGFISNACRPDKHPLITIARALSLSDKSPDRENRCAVLP